MKKTPPPPPPPLGTGAKTSQQGAGDPVGDRLVQSVGSSVLRSHIHQNDGQWEESVPMGAGRPKRGDSQMGPGGLPRGDSKGRQRGNSRRLRLHGEAPRPQGGLRGRLQGGGPRGWGGPPRGDSRGVDSRVGILQQGAGSESEGRGAGPERERRRGSGRVSLPETNAALNPGSWSQTKN
ncbi:unnamed protein product [Boreogadus saida]